MALNLRCGVYLVKGLLPTLNFECPSAINLLMLNENVLQGLSFKILQLVVLRGPNTDIPNVRT